MHNKLNNGRRTTPFRPFDKTQGLARRLLAWIICINAIAAVIATSIQLYLDYQGDVSEFEQGMHYIEQSQLPGLADAAWNFNVASMQVQLDGIGRSPWVAGAHVRYGPNQSAELHTGLHNLKDQSTFEYALQRNGALVGKIYITPNRDMLYRRTLDRFLVVLFTQIGKAVVTTISIFLLISWLITKPLTQIAQFAKSFEPGSNFRRFSLRRASSNRHDELNILVDALNDAYQRIQKAHEFEVRHAEILRAEVAARTEELRQAQQNLAKLSITDKLTGILNRLGLDQSFQTALAHAVNSNSPLAVILCDIDHFKAVNDNYGHLAGDQALQEFSRILSLNLRDCDVLGRWGGEEFLIICPQTGLPEAILLAEQLRGAVQSHEFNSIGHKTSSFGVAELHNNERAEQLIKRADDALYQAKRTGRNRVCYETSQQNS